jgi:hypothetical protein
MVSRRRDRECFTTYTRSRRHRVSHDGIDPALDADSALRTLQFAGDEADAEHRPDVGDRLRAATGGVRGR